MKNNSYKIILTALFAALTCVATMLIHIPTPGTGGYVNLGDGVALMCAFLLTPGYAFAAAGIGSALADILSGYMVYAPATLIIKGGLAVIAWVLAHKGFQNRRTFSRVIAGIAAEIFMVVGYLFFEATILGYGIGAAASVPANMFQGLVGIIISILLTRALESSREIRELTEKFNA